MSDPSRKRDLTDDKATLWRMGPFVADFVAEIGIPTARDGWWIF
jgi:hypothetical protein